MEGHGLVTVILGTAEELRVKRERNYTLRVTIVTEYTNISSTTEFSEEKQTSSYSHTCYCKLAPVGTEAQLNSPGIIPLHTDCSLQYINCRGTD